MSQSCSPLPTDRTSGDNNMGTLNNPLVKVNHTAKTPVPETSGKDEIDDENSFMSLFKQTSLKKRDFTPTLPSLQVARKMPAQRYLNPLTVKNPPSRHNN